MNPEDSAPETTDVVSPEAEEAINDVLSDDEPASDSKPVEPATPTDPEAAPPAEPEPKEEPVEPAEPEEPKDDQPKDDQPKEPAEPTDPAEIARQRYEERQLAKANRRAEVQEQNKTYVEDATDEYDRRLRNMEVQRYADTIEHNENTLVTEFERAKANPELQIFNPTSPEFNQRLYEKTLKDYNAGYLAYDENENLVQVKGSLYEHLQETADLYRGAVKHGQVQQVRDSRKTRSNADTKPAAQPKETVKDPILEVLMSD